MLSQTKSQWKGKKRDKESARNKREKEMAEHGGIRILLKSSQVWGHCLTINNYYITYNLFYYNCGQEASSLASIFGLEVLSILTLSPSLLRDLETSCRGSQSPWRILISIISLNSCVYVFHTLESSLFLLYHEQCRHL